jgi:hypothetical protein
MRMHFGMFKCLLLVFGVMMTFLFIRCDDGDGSVDTYPEIGQGFLTVLPMNPEDFYLFVNVGHLNPPGHTFPSDHGGFYLTRWQEKTPVFSPTDMTITEISGVEHVEAGFSDYDMTLSANDGGFLVVFGHLSSINPSILDQAPPLEEGNCFTYIAGEIEYRRCGVTTKIHVMAGDTVGFAGGNPGMGGIDFGTFDYNRPVEFASERFEDYRLVYTVSPLDYFIDEIRNVLIPVCGDMECGSVKIRTQEPVGGTVAYDRPGTAQGLWFRARQPTYPEDLHIALIYDNVEPEIPVFSVGNSLTGLNSGMYTFTPADTGVVDRLFDEVLPDGRIYRYNIRYQCSNAPVFNAVILLELTDPETMRIEKKNASDGPPWVFSENAIEFVR